MHITWNICFAMYMWNIKICCSFYPSSRDNKISTLYCRNNKQSRENRTKTPNSNEIQNGKSLILFVEINISTVNKKITWIINTPIHKSNYLFFVFFIYLALVPAVITFCSTETNMTHDGVPIPEACRKLEEAGADVVGVNCSRGPVTMMPLVKEIKKVCKVIYWFICKMA